MESPCSEIWPLFYFVPQPSRIGSLWILTEGWSIYCWKFERKTTFWTQRCQTLILNRFESWPSNTWDTKFENVIYTNANKTLMCSNIGSKSDMSAKSVYCNSEILTEGCQADSAAQDSAFRKSWRCLPSSFCLGGCCPGKPENQLICDANLGKYQMSLKLGKVAHKESWVHA